MFLRVFIRDEAWRMHRFIVQFDVSRQMFLVFTTLNVDGKNLNLWFVAMRCSKVALIESRRDLSSNQHVLRQNRKVRKHASFA